MEKDKGKEQAAKKKGKKVAEPKQKRVPIAKQKKGKQQQESEFDPAEEEEVDECETMPSGSSTAPTKKKASKKYKYSDYYKALYAIEWVPTKFPDVELLHRLGIYDDVRMIMTNMGIAKLLGMRHPHSKPEGCQFLASLDAVFYNPPTEEHGSGLIKFKVNGKGYEMGFKELSAILGFPEGPRTKMPNHKYETGVLWKEIGSGQHTPGSIANTGIKHPATRYVHKILADTFYGRPELSKVKENELKFLTIGLRPLFGGVFNNGRQIMTGRKEGELNVVSLFVKRLLELKEWGCTHRDKDPLIRLGGMITPILLARPITLTPTTTDMRGDLIDEFYLQKTGYLEGKCGDMYAYKYKDFEGTQIKVLLPNPALTSMAHRNNISFDLCHSPHCYDPTKHGVLQLITLDSMKAAGYQRAARERAAIREEVQPPSPIYGSARYHFSPHDHALPTGPLLEAHKKIEKLQRWNKWQDRSLRKVVSGYEKMAKGYKKMKEQVKHLTRLIGSGNKQRKRSSASHQDEEAGPSAPSHHRRAASCDLDGFDEPPQLQRSATTGRRQRRKMKTPSPPVSDNESLDLDMECFSPEPSCSPPHYHF